MAKELVLRLRTDGEYLAHAVMRQALAEIAIRAEEEPFAFGTEEAGEIADHALEIAAHLEDDDGA